jgi:hypothetical protein
LEKLRLVPTRLGAVLRCIFVAWTKGVPAVLAAAPEEANVANPN